MSDDPIAKAIAADIFPEYILIGGPFDGQRGVTAPIRGIISAIDISPTPVARYDLVQVDGYPSRDDDGVYRYQWHEAGKVT